MKKFISGLTLLTVVILLASCQDEPFWQNGNTSKFTLSENEIAFKVGNDVTTTRAEVQRTVVAPSNIIELPVQDGEEKFILMETVTSLDEEVFNTFDGAVTRGTPIYTENFDKVSGYNAFHGIGFDASQVASGNTGAFTVAESTIPRTEDEYQSGDYDDDSWGSRGLQLFSPKKDDNNNVVKLTYSHDYKDGHNLQWPTGDKLYFFFQAPTDMYATSTTVEGETVKTPGVSNIQYMKNGSIKFHYTSPTAAKDQKDILFTSKEIERDTDSDKDSKVTNILFYHALCGIKFKVGKHKDHNIDVQVTGVKFINYPSEGDCTITPNYTDDNTSAKNNPSNKNGAANTKSADCVEWEIVENAVQTYELSFENIAGEGKNTVNGSEEWCTTTTGTNGIPTYTPNTDSYFPESFFANGVSTDEDLEYYKESTADNNYNNKYYEYTFMFIPQALANTEAEIEITYKYVYGDGHYEEQTVHTNTSTVKLPKLGHEWNAGELHTYYLTSEGVYLSVEDKVENNLKTSLEVTNTGTFVQYQRALMYANWVYTDANYNHLIVASEELPETVGQGTGDGYKITGYFNDNSATSYVDFPGPNWAEGSDGFYYYRYPINVGNKPNFPLFYTYTGPTKTKFPGTHLEFDISAQAIRVSVFDYEPDEYEKDAFADEKWNLDNVTVVRHGVVYNAGTPATETAAAVPGGTTQQNVNAVGQKMSAWLQTTVEVFNKTLPGNNNSK